MLKKLNSALFELMPLCGVLATVSLAVNGYTVAKYEFFPPADQAVNEPAAPVAPQPVGPQPVIPQDAAVSPENTLKLPLPEGFADRVRKHETKPGAFVQFQLTEQELIVRLGEVPAGKP